MAKVSPVAEKNLIAHLLEAQAHEFYEGAECISESRRFGAGDSAYFLRLTSIELYFKLLYLLDTESLIFGHDLREIFDLMPRSSRNATFELFNHGLRRRLELSEFRDWLKYLGDLFVRIRYPFDEFREMPIEEYEAKIKRFEQAAADDFSDASIVYHIDRVTALVAALRTRVDSQRAASA